MPSMHLSIAILSLFLFFGQTIAFAAPGTALQAGGQKGAAPQAPILLFSDLISAPKNGWSNANPMKGAVVTVWGKYLGTLSENNYITVNGVPLNLASDYPETWGQVNNPVSFLQSITFQLHDGMMAGSGEITVTVEGQVSNALPFHINTGTIYFVDDVAGTGDGTFESPWGLSGIDNMISAMTPGDVTYFREGVYDQKLNGGKSVIWVRDSEPGGTAQDPIALVGYPGEDAFFDGLTHGDSSNFNKGILIDASYYTVSKMRVLALSNAIGVNDYGRIIGNDVEGTKVFVSGQGIVQAGANGEKILGNAIHGSRSENRLDHAVYLSGCQEIIGAEIAYNHSFDHYFDRGPHFVDNHQVDRCPSDEYMKSNYWHHNLIVCGEDERAMGGIDNRSRGIGIFDLSWDDGDATEPEPAFVYNNILVGCGKDDHGAMYHSNGHAIFLNNTLLNTQGRGIQVNSGLSLTTEIKNNVIVQDAQISENYIDFSQAASIPDVDSNTYFGGSASAFAGDLNPVEMDPQLILDVSAFLPVTVSHNSPLIDAGNSSVIDIVDDDFNLLSRPQAIDIGAVEYWQNAESPVFRNGFESHP